MATREENIKKINDELEKLTDDELDQVAGGGYHSIATPKQENQKPEFEIVAAIR